jgi:hypothetical protein
VGELSKTYLLRFEAANFDNTLFDMPKLSPIRGASMSYLLSSELVKRTLEERKKNHGLGFETVYTGASQGLFKLTGTPDAVRGAVEAVEAALSNDDIEGDRPTGVHSHLAYVTALVECGGEKGGDEKAAAAAEALCHIRQRQGAGAPLPEFEAGSQTFDKEGDRASPAVPGLKVNGTPASRARADRHDFGRDQRNNIYNHIAENVPVDMELVFVSDFETMVKDPPTLPGGSAMALSLQHKVAVFFADGNGLGKARDKALESGLEGLSGFSRELKALQKDLMRNIIGWLKAGAKGANSGAYVSSQKESLKKEFRFETLLWGGDEVMFVMPSWLGVEFAGQFFEWTKDWDIKGDKVTFSAGMVICNHKTPIRQSKAIADALVDAAKIVSKANGNCSAFQFEVFESLALPETDFAGYRKRMYFKTNPTDKDYAALNAELTIVKNDGFATLVKNITALKSGDDSTGRCVVRDRLVKNITALKSGPMPLPRSQLYNLLRDVTRIGIDAARSPAGEAELKAAYETYLKRAGEEKAPGVEALEIMRDCTGNHATLAISLITLAALWDYVEWDYVEPLEDIAAGGEA